MIKRRLLDWQGQFFEDLQGTFTIRLKFVFIADETQSIRERPLGNDMDFLYPYSKLYTVDSWGVIKDNTKGVTKNVTSPPK